MGERSAVRPKSGKSVSQSDPGLRRPTPPSTAGRKPAARPSILFPSATGTKTIAIAREVVITQRKTGRGTGQSPANQARREALGSFTSSFQSDPIQSDTLDDSQIGTLIEFFQTLDRWDKEAHGTQIM